MTPREPTAPKAWPLVVDLDGTLTPTDTLVESALALVRQKPWAVLALLWWLLSGRAGLKARLAQHWRLDVTHLPWRQDFIDWVQSERSSGRRVVLATAAHEQIAGDVATLLPMFDQVLASRAGHNLKGSAKLSAIQREVGPDFVYAGDSRADLPVWAAARGAVLVGVSPSVARRARGLCPVEKEFAGVRAGAALWLRAIRMHQWVKNLLLFVPIFLSFGFRDLDKLATVLAAFAAFSLAASATYLLNDLWDLDSDRQHPRKRQRPLASGALPISQGLLGAASLLALGFMIAWTTGPAFVVMLAGYVVLTTAYSWVLKRYVLMDVVMLALLYTYRVLAGAVVIQISVTPWLLAFSAFIFLSLALVKRCAELVSLAEQGKVEAKGRDYRVSDLVVLWPLGIGASLCSVVVFGLFIGTPEARLAYGDTSLLWLVGIGLIYWLARMWIKTSRGEMHDDPIVFALKDRGSRWVITAMAVVPLALQLLKQR